MGGKFSMNFVTDTFILHFNECADDSRKVSESEAKKISEKYAAKLTELNIVIEQWDYKGYIRSNNLGLEECLSLWISGLKRQTGIPTTIHTATLDHDQGWRRYQAGQMKKAFSSVVTSDILSFKRQVLYAKLLIDNHGKKCRFWGESLNEDFMKKQNDKMVVLEDLIKNHGPDGDKPDNLISAKDCFYENTQGWEDKWSSRILMPVHTHDHGVLYVDFLRARGVAFYKDTTGRYLYHKDGTYVVQRWDW